jgi:hypothetical protein
LLQSWEAIRFLFLDALANGAMKLHQCLQDIVHVKTERYRMTFVRFQTELILVLNKGDLYLWNSNIFSTEVILEETNVILSIYSYILSDRKSDENVMSCE